MCLRITCRHLQVADRRMPSRVNVSSTRRAPNSRAESRTTRSCRALKPPVFSAKALVRSSKVLSKLCAMSRRRKLNNVPWLKGGCSASRQSSISCQRLSLTVSSTAQSTERPLLSTLYELLSKHLISVLAADAVTKAG